MTVRQKFWLGFAIGAIVGIGVFMYAGFVLWEGPLG